MRIDQFLPYLGYGDAITTHALWIREALRRWGYCSDIYAETFDPRMRRQGKSFTEYRCQADGKVIFHYYAASAISDFILGLNKKVIVIYHNITPYEFFRPVNHRIAQNLLRTREELRRFADVADLALGDSEFNRLELQASGFANTAVLPIPLNTGNLEVRPDPHLAQVYDVDSHVNFLFVGRVAPNKKHEDILKVFAYYSKAIDPSSRLFLVGSSSETEVYLEWLLWLAERLGLRNVHFTGQVTQSQLVAYYRLAHAFVCMSEHEGFCVPLLESMYFQVPVVAYACPAVAWTLGDAGILVKAREYDIIAEALHVVVTNGHLRQKLIERQNARLQAFAPERVEGMLRGYLELEEPISRIAADRIRDIG